MAGLFFDTEDREWDHRGQSDSGQPMTLEEEEEDLKRRRKLWRDRGVLDLLDKKPSWDDYYDL